MSRHPLEDDAMGHVDKENNFLLCVHGLKTVFLSEMK